jgi:hypothetical protein
VDSRLERGARLRFAQGFLEQLGTPIDLDLGEQNESLRTLRTDLRFIKKLGPDRPRACPLSSTLMRMSGRQRAAMTVLATVRRRQSQCLLGKLGRDRRRAAVDRDPHCVVELSGDTFVRSVPRESKVASAEDRVIDDGCDTRMDAPALFAEIPIENRRQQGMGEANHPVRKLDHVCIGGRLERALTNARSLEERFRGSSPSCSQPERLASGCRQAHEARTNELFERSRNRERLQWIDVLVERTGDLEREERIAARSLVDAEQRLARKRPLQPIAQEPVERTDAERADPKELNTV